LLVAKIAPHGVAADSELFGDAANRSPLAMHGFDVHPGLQCEHPGLRLRGREKGPGSSYIRGRVVASAASRLRPDSPASWGGSVFNRRRRVNFQPAMTLGESTFYRLYRRAFSALPASLMVRFEGVAGEFAQFDFGEVDVRLLDGRKRRVNFAGYRLKYSRWILVGVVRDDRIESLVRALLMAFEASGGVELFSKVVDGVT